MKPETSSRPILYPPTIIGHITEDITDLFAPKVQGTKSMRVYYGCQLNGHPHLGTAISLMSAFALAQHMKERYGKPASVVFGALENGPGEKKKVDGILYQRMLCDTIRDGRTLADTHLDSFVSLLTSLSNLSDVPHAVEFYRNLQAQPTARRTLLELIARESEFVPLLNPSDDRLRVRFSCDSDGCGYQEKHARTLSVVEHKPRERVVLESVCFDHGPHQTAIEPRNDTFFDVNTMVRNVLKEATIAHEAKEGQFFPLIVKGADWMHAAVLVSNALELLGYNSRQRPERIATPMIEDWSGAKFSKSVYVKLGTYAGLPEELVSLQGFLDEFGEQGFESLWSHVREWVTDPKKFYRNYSLEYLGKLFEDMKND